MTKKLSGRCMCGGIEYSCDLDRDEVTACHCGQCRKWSGHVWASVNVAFNSLTITKGENLLSWFRSSDFARRGFCKGCGSAMFWHGDKLDDHKHRIAIAAGTILGEPPIKLSEHIFVIDKGNYYEIDDGLPQLETH